MRRLILTLLVLLTGCAGNFEEARLATPATVQKQEPGYCHALESKRIFWGGISKGSALLAGSTGLATLQVDGETARAAIAGTALGFGALAAVAVYVSEKEGESWVRDCSH